MVLPVLRILEAFDIRNFFFGGGFSLGFLFLHAFFVPDCINTGGLNNKNQRNVRNNMDPA